MGTRRQIPGTRCVRIVVLLRSLWVYYDLDKAYTNKHQIAAPRVDIFVLSVMAISTVILSYLTL